MIKLRIKLRENTREPITVFRNIIFVRSTLTYFAIFHFYDETNVHPKNLFYILHCNLFYIYNFTLNEDRIRIRQESSLNTTTKDEDIFITWWKKKAPWATAASKQWWISAKSQIPNCSAGRITKSPESVSIQSVKCLLCVVNKIATIVETTYTEYAL